MRFEAVLREDRLELDGAMVAGMSAADALEAVARQDATFAGITEKPT